jgi:hypothetical protein
MKAYFSDFVFLAVVLTLFIFLIGLIDKAGRENLEKDVKALRERVERLEIRMELIR